MKKSFDLFSALRKRFTGRKKAALSLKESDSFFDVGESVTGVRDRPLANYRSIIEAGLNAWRDDPLARRIVSLTTQFSIGRGFRISADDPAADDFLHEFWEHPLNRMDTRLLEWSDELCRTGNLFIMFASDKGGMSYVRAIPAGLIEEIVPFENDIEQTKYFRLREIGDPQTRMIPEEKTVYTASLMEPTEGEAMLHFTVNRPIGGQWGESDLAPVLPWLTRYQEWLKDRWSLNHYRSSFIYLVKAPDLSEDMRKMREAQLNNSQMQPGMIFVAGSNEEWVAVHPNLDSGEANEDGLAIKKVIAAGVGIPVSFLAEPGASSKAETGGIEDSACRNFRQRQQLLMWITETILRHVLARAALVRRNLDKSAEIHVYGDDISLPGMTEGGIIRA